MSENELEKHRAQIIEFITRHVGTWALGPVDMWQTVTLYHLFLFCAAPRENEDEVALIRELGSL